MMLVPRPEKRFYTDSVTVRGAQTVGGRIFFGGWASLNKFIKAAKGARFLMMSETQVH